MKIRMQRTKRVFDCIRRYKIKLSTETLMEEVKPVVTEKVEFEHEKKHY